MGSAQLIEPVHFTIFLGFGCMKLAHLPLNALYVAEYKILMLHKYHSVAQ